MGSTSIEQWRIPLSDNDLKSLQDAAGYQTDDSFTIVGIYLSDVALVVHLRIQSETAKNAIGRLLRFISYQAEMFGFILPCLGVLEASSIAVRPWAADQDWHRGDFALFVIKSPPTEQGAQAVEEGPGKPITKIQQLLGSTFEAWMNIPQLAPLTEDQYFDRVWDEWNTSAITEEHKSLLEAIISAGENEEPIQQAVDQWVADQLNRVESLIEGADGDA